jgi:hypothetical protein
MASGLALASALAAAQAPAGPSAVRAVFGVAVTSGGDTLVSVSYTDGSSQNIKSGGLLHLFGGAEFDLGSMVVQTTLGYHVDDTNATNASVRFVRYPLELLGFWKAGEAWRVGGGVRKALDARVTSSGAARASIGGAGFDSKPGFVLQAEYLFGAGSVHGRIVGEQYTVGGRSVDGNHIGLGVAYRF